MARGTRALLRIIEAGLEGKLNTVFEKGGVKKLANVKQRRNAPQIGSEKPMIKMKPKVR